MKAPMIICENPDCNCKENLSRHYLFPKNVTYSTYIDDVPSIIKISEADYVRMAGRELIILCYGCHQFLHDLKTNRELAIEYNTKESVIELLIENKKALKRYKWVGGKKIGVCENPNCGSREYLTKHHLYPKGYRLYVSSNAPITKKSMCLCRKCHDIVHRLKTNYELANYYNTVESVIRLLQDNTLNAGDVLIMINQNRSDVYEAIAV